MTRFAGPQSDQTDVPGRRGVHPPLSPAHSAQRLCEDPAFRLSFEPQSQDHGSALPESAAAIGRYVSYDRAPRTSLPGLQNRSPPCDRMAASTAVALHPGIVLPITSGRLFVKTMVILVQARHQMQLTTPRHMERVSSRVEKNAAKTDCPSLLGRIVTRHIYFPKLLSSKPPNTPEQIQHAGNQSP
jgi:hypothetical protein